MNGRRSILVARIGFASEGTTLDEPAWNKRKALHLGQLTDELPSLRNLKASQLDILIDVSEGAAHLIFMLRESDQMSLRFSKGVGVHADLFEQDVQAIRSEQASLGERYQEALKSHASPVHSPELIGLRRQTWRSRGDGYIILNSSPVGERLDTSGISHVLPQGALVEAAGVVTRLSRDEVRVLLRNDLLCPLTHDFLFGKESHISLYLRSSVRDLKSFLELAAAMHRKDLLTLQVAIDYGWIDGTPHRLSLLKYSALGTNLDA